MDKEFLTIIIKVTTPNSVGDHYEDERRFEVSIPSRGEVSSLFDEFTSMINNHKGWEQ